MDSNILYKVLWVEDDHTIIEGFKGIARGKHIILDWYDNWESAKTSLIKSFDSYSAIIFDANCKADKDTGADYLFLLDAITSLNGIFGKKQRSLPWYVLSAGTMDRFSDVVGKISNIREKNHDEDLEKWGQMLHLKDSLYDLDDSTCGNDIFDCISTVAANQNRNKVIALHKDIFDAVKVVGLSEKVSEIIIPIFVAIHFPEDARDFNAVYQYNQLRRLLEYVFRSFNKLYGLIPNECIPEGIVNLNQCSLYLAGKDAERTGVRYGEAGDRIVPEHIEAAIRSVLEICNIRSHTVDLDDKDLAMVEELLSAPSSRYTIFRLALSLCEVILWAKLYLSDEVNADREENLHKCQHINNDSKADYLNKEFLVEEDGNGNFHCGGCRLPFNQAKGLKGLKVKLTEIVDSNEQYKNLFPFFARKFELIDSSMQNGCTDER